MTADIEVIDAPAGYAFLRDDADGTWAYLLHGELIADGFTRFADALTSVLDHLAEQQPAEPEWCDRCGDQAVCPDCVGA